ncbi:RER1 protein [Pavlovales sp. CCMP2436]|nr:RER1 protein [Pavlovales sp. CCMP2436]
MYDGAAGMEESVGDSSAAARLSSTFGRKLQHYLDKAAPHTAARWVTATLLTLLYALRVYFLNGWYIVTYGLGIYLLNLLIAFLSPQIDPEMEGPTLPNSREDEFRPFQRRLPEFKFWYSYVKAFLTAFVMTFFELFNIPVFWPILLLYFITLFVLTMKRQIKHMIKYRYVEAFVETPN